MTVRVIALAAVGGESVRQDAQTCRIGTAKDNNDGIPPLRRVSPRTRDRQKDS